MGAFYGAIFVVLVGVSLYLYLTATMKNERGAYCGGLILGALTMGYLVITVAEIVTFTGPDYYTEAKVLIDECERSLPRDQKCVIEMVAVVDKSPNK